MNPSYKADDKYQMTDTNVNGLVLIISNLLSILVKEFLIVYVKPILSFLMQLNIQDLCF